MDNLRESLATARGNGVEVRGIAVINPGNPTGNILAEDQIKDIIQVQYCRRCLTCDSIGPRPTSAKDTDSVTVYDIILLLSVMQ